MKINKKQINMALIVVFALLAVALSVEIYHKLNLPTVLSDYDLVLATDDTAETKTNFYQQQAEKLKQANLFVPPPPKPGPPGRVDGILGQKAYFNGKGYAVGETVPPGAKVISIEPTYVKLLWQEKEITLAPIKAIKN